MNVAPIEAILRQCRRLIPEYWIEFALNFTITNFVREEFERKTPILFSTGKYVDLSAHSADTNIDDEDGAKCTNVKGFRESAALPLRTLATATMNQ